MNYIVHSAKAAHFRRRISLAFASIFGILTMMMMILLASAPASAASPTTVNLNTDSGFAVLAYSTVTNTGSTVLSGSLGLYPGTASSITGFPPGTVINGATYAADATSLQAQTDLTTAYNDAASRTATGAIVADLGGQTLVSGVYNSASSIGLTGTLILDGQNNANAVFIFQAGSTLTTASASTVSLINGAQACNVFWQVGSSATIGTTSTFVGTVMAQISDTVDTGSTVQGRILARTGAVTLDTNTITAPSCAAVASPVVTTTTTTSTTSTTTTLAPTTTTTSAPATTTTTTTSPLVIPASGPGPSGASVIPVGAPQTGFGGASKSTDRRTMFAFGGLSLLGALSAGTQVMRSRRIMSKSDTSSD